MSAAELEAAGKTIRESLVADVGPPKVAVHVFVEWAARSIVWAVYGPPPPPGHATAIERCIWPNEQSWHHAQWVVHLRQQLAMMSGLSGQPSPILKGLPK